MVLVDMSVLVSSSAIDQELANLGFEVAFINMTVNTKSHQSAKLAEHLKQVNQSSGIVTVTNRPPGRCVTRDILGLLAKQSKPFVLHKLSRVTVALQQSDHVDKVYDTILRPIRDDPRIDCFAVRPATETQLIDLINNRAKYGYDLISLDISVGYFFQQLGVVARLLKNSTDVFIEVELGPILNNTSGITNCVNQCRMVMRSFHRMIISSGAKSPLELRTGLDMRSWGEGVMGLKHVNQNSERLLEKIVRKKMNRANLNPSSN